MKRVKAQQALSRPSKGGLFLNYNNMKDFFVFLLKFLVIAFAIYFGWKGVYDRACYHLLIYLMIKISEK